jgi:hypothetical protein
MNREGQERMRQAIEPEMHRKALLRTAELVAMDWTTAHGPSVTSGSAARARRLSRRASLAPSSAHCSRS